MLMLHYKGNRIPLFRTKIFQIPLAGETIKDGERSSENGLNPLKLLPLFSIGQNHNLLYTSSFKNSIYSRFRNHYFFFVKRQIYFDF
jgi:hypothetical protein